ncbi:MAG: DUF3147 family protein [Planctomycetes bacterium]|nr:DUF3147 family protein [Planctomycetota bacterium]
MRFAIKLAVSLAIIILCGQIGKKMPSLAGLIAVMPLTGLVVMLWVYGDCEGDVAIMQRYCKAALWGIGPSMLFFGAALLCFHKRWPISLVLGVSFGIWVIAAAVHQWFLHGR